MKRALNIQSELQQVNTIQGLTGVFENIASIKIARIRNRVVASKEFFAVLWQTYSAIRIEAGARTTQRQSMQRDVFVAITAEGKLSGSVDEQVIEAMLKEYQSRQNTDIVVIGMHGVSQLERRHVPIAKSFHMPAGDEDISVAEVIDELAHYRRINVFYQTYDSLRVQKVTSIELHSTVKELGSDVEEGTEVVSSRDYIFEPDLDRIVDYLESVMLGVALIQIIMESKLAQYASRFNSMSAGKQRAGVLANEYSHQFYRARRAENDERLKEMMKVVRRG